MGGHGGLNILPQKKWNVYNRDNRLKVARDEAAHEQKQQDLNGKHNAAEREHRRLALKERARQRHGGAATINLDTLEAAEDQPVVSHRYLQIESRAALPQGIGGGDAADPMLSLETAAAATTTGATNRSLPPSNKRQRRGKQPEKSLQQPAPSLAHLASQLDSAPHPLAAAGEAAQTEKEEVEEPTKLQSFGHFNLFAEEEARAKNPEKTAEQRLLLSKRGDAKTQTMDARFDESFQLAYGLGAGKNAKAPWYVQNTASTLLGPGSKLEAGVEAETGAAAVMEKWKEDGRAALIAAESGGNDTGDADAEMMLLKGVKIIPKDGKKKKKEKEKSSSSRREDVVDGRRRQEVKKEDQWSKLREERLLREQEEQKRQNEAVRSATLGSSGGGRRPRYNTTYGHGR
jgi:hypothetical protein